MRISRPISKKNTEKKRLQSREIPENAKKNPAEKAGLKDSAMFLKKIEP